MCLGKGSKADIKVNKWGANIGQEKEKEINAKTRSWLDQILCPSGVQEEPLEMHLLHVCAAGIPQQLGGTG